MDPGQVGVTAASWLINLVTWLVGGLLGILLGQAIAQSVPGNWGLVIGLVCGALIFALLALAALGVTNFSLAVYQTCLYIWVHQVEQPQTGSESVAVTPPTPLAEALAGAASLSAPIFSE
jgi:hypothetical protein